MENITYLKDNAHGGTLIWQIGFCEDQSELIIAHGTLITSKGVPGSIQIKTHPIKTNNSGRTLQQQALLEGRRKYIDKWKDAYKPAGDDSSIRSR